MEQFRQRVAKLLECHFPELAIELPSDNPGILRIGGVNYGLQNLKANYELSDLEESTLHSLVAEHFQSALAAEPVTPDFLHAGALLRPQIMPAEYSRVPIISFPFGETLAVGVVLDSEGSYTYVRNEDALAWQKSPADLLDLAIKNLDEAVRGKTKMHRSQKEETIWFAVETDDGFAAARILLPGFRAFLAKSLGNPFQFAVPNREFLICWNKAASTDFTGSAHKKIKSDFERQPYPLSPNVFETTVEGSVNELIS